MAIHYEVPSWIEEDSGTYAVFEMLVAFLHEVSEDPSSLDQLVASTTELIASIGTPNPTAEEYRAETRALFGIILTFAQQLDATAAEQGYLVALVKSFRTMPLPATVRETIHEDALDDDMNLGLFSLINVLANFEHDAPLHPRLEDRRECTERITGPRPRPPWRQKPGRFLTATQWASLNAFLARLHAAVPTVDLVDLRGLFAMIEALERPLSPSQLEDAVPAAAVWILYAGTELRTNDVPYAFSKNDALRRPWSRGELWEGPHAFSPPRWDFWMQRFKVIADRSDVDETTRQ